MKNIVNKLTLAGASGVLAVSATYMIIPQEGEVVNKNGEHVVYKDIVGVATACWGQTGRDMEGVKISPGDVYSEDYCARWFSKELVEYNKNMRKHVTVNILPYEEVAYTSFVWNLGATNFKNSTLLKKLHAGDRAGACAELLRWNKVTVSPTQASVYQKRGEVCTQLSSGNFSCTVKGLTNRRTDEYKVCMGENADVNKALQELSLSNEEPLTVGNNGLKTIENEEELPTPQLGEITVSSPHKSLTTPVPERVCTKKFLFWCFKYDSL